MVVISWVNSSLTGVLAASPLARSAYHVWLREGNHAAPGRAARESAVRPAPMASTFDMTTRPTRQDALDYHSSGRKGKIEVVPTKPCATARDLSLAYSPGVAEP